MGTEDDNTRLYSERMMNVLMNAAFKEMRTIEKEEGINPKEIIMRANMGLSYFIATYALNIIDEDKETMELLVDLIAKNAKLMITGADMESVERVALQ